VPPEPLRDLEGSDVEALKVAEELADYDRVDSPRFTT
jgi:hypothetical protein